MYSLCFRIEMKYFGIPVSQFKHVVKHKSYLYASVCLLVTFVTFYSVLAFRGHTLYGLPFPAPSNDKCLLKRTVCNELLRCPSFIKHHEWPCVSSASWVTEARRRRTNPQEKHREMDSL